MQAHQQRVVDEQVELDGKADKLLVFLGTAIYHDLDAGEQKRLQRQYSLMREYASVLAERIAAFQEG